METFRLLRNRVVVWMLFGSFLGCFGLVVACADGDGGSSTGPSEVAELCVNMTSTGGLTIEQADLFFDGTLLDSQPATGGPVVMVMLKGTVSTSQGVHVVRITIVRQTSSPTRYVAQGNLTLGSQTVQLDPQTENLATGESLSWEITF